MRFADVEGALREAGLAARGGFAPGPGDDVPDVAPGVAARAIVLVGNAGPEMWARFSQERREESDPLDRWTERVVTRLAAALGAHALFPFQRPYFPFQRWARKAEACYPSPLGLLLHSEYGLWHGYRAALLFARALDLPEAASRTPSACEKCADRPCLSVCPVGAFSGTSYDVGRCVAHLVASPRGDCVLEGCRARRACPVGASFRYVPAQAEFHMAAFIRNHAKA